MVTKLMMCMSFAGVCGGLLSCSHYTAVPDVKDHTSFPESWLLAAPANVLATVEEDAVDGTFRITARSVIGEGMLQFEVIEGGNDSDSPKSKYWTVQYGEEDRIVDYIASVLHWIDNFGEVGMQVSGGGPTSKYHLSTNSGQLIRIPFGGLSAEHYDVLELAAIGELSDRQAQLSEMSMPAPSYAIELLVNELDAHGLRLETSE
jgi:hypothetical protein